MKIVIDARESGTSTGRYVDKLIEYLHKLKPKHEFIVLTKPRRLSFMKQIAPDFKAIESDFKEFTWAEQTGFLKQLNTLGADLVHFAMPQQPVRYHGMKITTFHDLTTVRFTNPDKNWLVFKFKQQVYKWVIQRAIKTSARIIAISNFTKDDLANFTGVNPGKISVIYEAANKITVALEPLQALVGQKFIMYVGRPTPHKNLSRLIKAFRVLANQNPELKLVLVGKTDANYQRLESNVANAGLSDQVIFTGFAGEGQLRWLYENTAAYVFPSLSEGFGLPGLEAMAHGAPVVSSNATCLPEIYGQAAHYFDPLDERDMAVKIAAIINNDDLRQKMIEEGYSQATKYSWGRMAQQTLDIYNKVLD